MFCFSFLFCFLVCLFLWLFGFHHGLKRQTDLPCTLFFFLWSRTGTNEYVFAEMSTATNVLRGRRAAGRHGSADCLSSSLPSSLGRAPRGHMQGSFWSPLYFTRVPSFFSPSLPSTSKIFGSLSGLRKYHLRLSRLQLRHSFFGGGGVGWGTASPHQAWGRGSSWRPRSNRVLLQGRASSELNHLSTCLSSLLLPFIGSFSSSLHPHPLPCLSPSPSSLEFILLVQNQSFTDEEWSLLEPCV